MNQKIQFCVKLIHCGNRNIANPEDNSEKSIFYIPMGLFSMASNLKKNGFEVEIINLDMELQPIDDIIDFSTVDAIGLDCHWVNQGLVVLEAAELIKRIKPDVFVFLGGYTASLFAGEILENYPVFDAVVRGDGEVPIVELCKVLRGETRTSPKKSLSLAGVQNLVWNSSGHKVVFNEFSYIASSDDLTCFNFTEIHLLRNWETYRDLCKFWTKFSPFNQFPLFFLEIGRGCTYNCSFCGGSSVAQKNIGNRVGYTLRSIESVISSIQDVVSCGYSSILISFEFEGCDLWYAKLFRRIKEENLRISCCYGCWDMPSKLLIDEISGCFDQVILEISPGTADHDVRKKNKDQRIFYTNEELEERLDYIATKSNVSVQMYFGYFLAFDSEETIFDTLEYIAKLIMKYSNCLEIIYSNLSTDPFSSIYLSPHKYDIDISVRSFSDYIDKIRENYLDKSGSPLNMTLFRPKNMSVEEAANLMNKVAMVKVIFSDFSNSMSLIFSRLGSMEPIFSYIKKIDLSMLGNNEITSERVRDVLLDICEENSIHSREIIHSIHEEYEAAPVINIASNQINISGKDQFNMMSEEKRKEISINLKRAQDAIEVDFEI
jgi:hypothetical protein